MIRQDDLEGVSIDERSGERTEPWTMTDDKPYKVIPLRASGVTPDAVAIQVEEAMNDGFIDGWLLDRIVPIIYNSSTTGYLLLIFVRAALSRA